jgi:8-oxo-dGTP diphosphatase
MVNLESERRFLFYVGIKALIIKDKKILLLSSGKEELSSTMRKRIFWDLPGGKIETGEQIEETLMREVSEETGVSKRDLKIARLFDVSVSNFKISHGQYIPLILVTYICKLKNPSRKFRLSNEHARYEWVDVEVAAARLSAKFNKSFIKKLLEFL